MAWNKNEKSEFFIDFNVPKSYIIRTISKNKYYPIIKIEFEGKMFNGMNDNDYCLRRTLGDYWQLPAIEKRTTHNIVTLDFGDGQIWNKEKDSIDLE